MSAQVKTREPFQFEQCDEESGRRKVSNLPAHANLRMKIVRAIHEATDQYGTAGGIAAEKILAIPEIRDALVQRERETRPKLRLPGK